MPTRSDEDSAYGSDGVLCTRRKAVLREAELEGLGEDLGHRDLKQKTRGNGTPQPHPPCKESTCKYPTSADINDPLSVLVATCPLVAAVFVATEAASPLHSEKPSPLSASPGRWLSRASRALPLPLSEVVRGPRGPRTTWELSSDGRKRSCARAARLIGVRLLCGFLAELGQDLTSLKGQT